MERSRLIAFGCSYTHGHTLPGCPDPESPPSIFAWPKKLAKLLKRKAVNMGIAGASNKQILYTIQCCDFMHDDIVVILWTYTNRDCIILDDTTSIMQGLPATSTFSPLPRDRWYHIKRAHSDYDGYHQMWTCMNYAKYQLDSIGIRNYHFTINTEYIGLQPFENPPKWNKVKIIDLCFQTLVDGFPKATDGKHPGQVAHEVLARSMKVRINAHNQ